ncbi:MAG TPA: NAD(P)/FAD-dependent oxidoreductase [Steroidobacteraceae bacterium]|nr:NAD(P)/FAD-dependent oxidoreductase [Steroidobacteraceae bacterium]
MKEDLRLLDEAVQKAHFHALLMSIVHLTGDVGLLTEERRARITDFVATDNGIAAEENARVRALARQVLTDHFAGRLPPAPPLDAKAIQRMMDFITGTTLPERYLPFLQEELGIASADPRHPGWSVTPAQRASGELNTLVIGAGMSGLLAAIRLQQAGIAFQVLEKNADVGGTWLENTYPGCRVDSNNQLYSYSFAPNAAWPQFFSTQPVLLEYFRGIADRYELRRHIRFNTTVEKMVFDAAAGTWNVTVRKPDGTAEQLTARIVISAVGQLNRPRFPDIPGRTGFRGDSFHSAQWRHDVPLQGRRVACIGTGASAFQFIPEIATEDCRIEVFQRTPPWLMPTPEYHDDVPAGERWALANIPYYLSWYRFWLFWLYVDGFHEFVKCDAAYQGDGRAVSASNAAVRERFEAVLRAQVGDRAALLEHVIPRYPFGGKRTLRDNGKWISTLKRPNVSLVTSAITRIDPDGIVTADGRHHPADVIIYGTGFQASRFLWPMQVIGSGGLTLQDKWGADARAYLGMTIPGFPNLFCLYGPNTNLVVNGSIIMFSECAMRYTMQALHHMQARGLKSLEVNEAVYDAYNRRIDQANSAMSWGIEGVSNWYKSPTGRVSQNWPLHTVDYWAMTREFDPSEYRER